MSRHKYRDLDDDNSRLRHTREWTCQLEKPQFILNTDRAKRQQCSIQALLERGQGDAVKPNSKSEGSINEKALYGR